jgi:flagellar hook assembly protein FlgD
LIELVDTFSLSEAYPNPFRQSANFDLAVSQAQQVEISLYDISGRKVQTVHAGQLAGQTTHNFMVEGNQLAAGSYILQVKGEHFATNKVISLVK